MDVKNTSKWSFAHPEDVRLECSLGMFNTALIGPSLPLAQPKEPPLFCQSNISVFRLKMRFFSLQAIAFDVLLLSWLNVDAPIWIDPN